MKVKWCYNDVFVAYYHLPISRHITESVASSLLLVLLLRLL